MKAWILLLVLLLSACVQRSETVEEENSEPLPPQPVVMTQQVPVAQAPVFPSQQVPVAQAPVFPPGGILYFIPKGNHYPANPIIIKFTSRRSASWQTYFYPDTEYTTVDPKNSIDINKLAGFSDCFSLSHHQNSARFGWFWDKDKKQMQLWAYTYVKGVRQSAYLKHLDLARIYSMSIQVDGGNYIFYVDGKQLRMPRGCSGYWAWGYELTPFFGGDESAPHNMNIWLRNI